MAMGTISIEAQGNTQHAGYWPFGVFSHTLFNGGSFSASDIQEDPPGNLFSVSASSGNDRGHLHRDFLREGWDNHRRRRRRNRHAVGRQSVCDACVTMDANKLMTITLMTITDSQNTTLAKATR